jgi:hypothetical protein
VDETLPTALQDAIDALPSERFDAVVVLMRGRPPGCRRLVPAPAMGGA